MHVLMSGLVNACIILCSIGSINNKAHLHGTLTCILDRSRLSLSLRSTMRCATLAKTFVKIHK